MLVLGDLASAQVAYEQALELDPDFGEAWRGKGRLLARLGQYEEALKALNRAVELAPGTKQAYCLRAMVHEEIGDSKRASRDLEQALELTREELLGNSLNPLTWFSLGLYLLVAAQPEQALANYREGMQYAHQFHLREALRDLEETNIWKEQIEGREEVRELLCAALERVENSVIEDRP